MKKTIVSLCLLFVGIIPGISQQESPDSLKRVLDRHHTNDKAKVDLICDFIVSKSLDLDASDESYLRESLEISKKINYKKGIAKTYFLFGWYHKYMSNHQKSIEYSFRALEMFKQQGNTRDILRTYSNLADVYVKENDFKTALELNLETIKLSEDTPDSQQKASYHFYTAKNYSSMGEFEKAQKHILRASEISEACGFQMGVEISKSTLGHNYISLKQYDKALPLLTEALAFSVSNERTINTAAILRSLGECYYELEQYESAIENLEKAAEIFETKGFRSALKLLYVLLGNCHEKLGRLKEAIVFHKKSAKVVEELQSEEQTKAIEELKTKYKTKELKQDKLLAQSREKVANEKEKVSRYTSYGLAIASIVMVGFLFYIARQLRIIGKQKRELNNAYEQLEVNKKNELAVSKLKAIRSQMNPHLVFNSINSIQALVLDKDVEKSYDYIEKFSSLFRKTLNYSEMNSIDLDKEIEFLSIYLELESLRMKEEFTFSIKKLTDQEISIPTLLIQPFIENAIHHGLLHKEGEKRLSVEFTLDDGLAKCIIQDNGIGRKVSREINSRQQKVESFSLSAINRRLELLGEQVGGHFDYLFDDLVDENGNSLGTLVTVSFPHTFNY